MQSDAVRVASLPLLDAFKTESMAGMISRIFDAINLAMLRTAEWLQDLSFFGRVALGLVLFALLTVAAHFGVIPRRHPGLNGRW
jgi:hypothetical protein